ncbi:hypothetical protein E3P96_00333 [Wallemia ichthyophaga]|nr:hypothetical protein E3P96_00333 [Wallemia ichthyophaga]
MMTTQAQEYFENKEAVQALQSELLGRCVDELEGELSETEMEMEMDDVRERSATFLRDKGSIFRFLKKAHYDGDAAYKAIKEHLRIRLQSNLDRLELPSLLSLISGGVVGEGDRESAEDEQLDASPPPVAYFLKDATDRLGRLVLVVTLSQVVPRQTYGTHDDDAFDEIKESVLYIWEVGRRLMQAQNGRGRENEREPCVEFLTVVDATHASMANIHYDIVRFFADIISVHFPNTSKQIVIVNSKLWTNALWRMAKPLLPRKIVDRISFVGRDRMGELLEIDSLPTYLGGERRYDRISDYATTSAPAEVHFTAAKRSTSSSTPWYTPKQTPDSSYTNLSVMNHTQSFQLQIKRGRRMNDNSSQPFVPSDLTSYSEQISAWHKERMGVGVKSESETPSRSLHSSAIASAVSTPRNTLDRYSYLNPRYGYRTIYSISRRTGKLSVQSKPRMWDLVVTLLHLALKRYGKRIKLVLMVAGVLLRHKMGIYVVTHTTQQNRRAILENLFKEGVIVAQKDYEIKHDELNVPNLEVIKLMQSLTSKGFVKTQFSWQWFYYTLTPEGLDYLREFLHLPSEIVPNTHRKAARPARPAQVRQQGEAFKGGRDDRDSYRRADAKEGADAGFRPRFGGVGRGAPRA